MPNFSLRGASFESWLAIIEERAPVVKEKDMTPIIIKIMQKALSAEF
jgi:hypothetical protein